LVDSERVCALWADPERRIQNLKPSYRITYVGDWGRQPPEAKGSGGRAPSVWRFLKFCNKNDEFLSIFRLKFLLKNIFN